MARHSMPRRLGLVVWPELGESFPSWVDRLAVDMAVPPGVVAVELGLELSGSRFMVRPLLFGVALTETSRAALRAATGVGDEVLDAMHLSAYDGTVLDFAGLDPTDGRSVQRLRLKQWALFHSSRACPDCLAETGGVWQTWWRLGGAAVCPRHGLLLHSSCLRCGMEIRQVTTRHHSALSRTAPALPGACNNRQDAVACGFPLSELPRTQVSRFLIDAQVAYLDAAAGQPPGIAGHRVGAVEWFTAFKAVAAMVRCAIPTTRIPVEAEVPASVSEVFALEVAYRQPGRCGRPGALRAMPRSAAQTLALLAFTGSVLSATDEAALAETIAPLAHAVAVRRRQTGHDPLKTLPIPALLRRAVLSVSPPTPTTRLSRHLAPFATATNGLFARALEFRYLPQLVAEDDYLDLIAVALPGAVPAGGRRFAALALARLCGAMSWRDAARALDLEVPRSQSIACRMACFVTGPEQLWRGVAAVAERLRQRGPVDYRARRQALSGLVTIPVGVLSTAYRRHGQSAPTNPRLGSCAAGWLWTQLTSGSLRDAPALAPASWPDTPATVRRKTVRRLVAALPPPVAAELLAWGHSLLDRRRTG